MTQFAAVGLVVLVIVSVGGALVLRQIGVSQTTEEARRLTETLAHGVIEPDLTDDLLDEAAQFLQGNPGDTDAIDRVDEVVEERILNEQVRRIKIWSPDGTIVYSDEERLIGMQFRLGPEEEGILYSETGESHAGLSDLSGGENQYEQGEGQLLEVYVPVKTREGHPLLFEAYLRFSSVLSGGTRLWLAFAPVLLAAAGLVTLVQVPLAWRMARRLHDSQVRREALLLQAIESSNAERRRIAGDVHDGVVQDLVGIAYAVDAAADRLNGDVPEDVEPTLRRVSLDTRQTMRKLRSQLVEMYPPDLHAAGLEAALSDLLTTVEERGILTGITVQSRLHLPPEVEALFFRASQEALRNVLQHAAADRVDVAVGTQHDTAYLQVQDDGCGFDPEEAARRRSEGHVGLRLLTDLADAAGGRLDVGARPQGGGTRLRMEVPLR